MNLFNKRDQNTNGSAIEKHLTFNIFQYLLLFYAIYIKNRLNNEKAFMLINIVVLIIGLYPNIGYIGIFHWSNYYLYLGPNNQGVQMVLKYLGSQSTSGDS